MKTILSIIAAVTMFCVAHAGIEAVQIFSDHDYIPRTAGKVLGVQVVSSVDTGKATVKSVANAWGVRDDVVSTTVTNVSYVLVWTNGENVVTNVTTYDQAPIPTNIAVESYKTNTVITTSSITNVIPTLIACVTNSLSSEITCAGGYGSAEISGKYLIPGEPVFYTGTAKGKVILLIER